MDESDYLALNQHLEEVLPIISRFNKLHDFSMVDRISLGRYPRIRIQKSTPLCIWFELWMKLDKDGRHYEEFRRDIPYELSAGAFTDIHEGSKDRFRYAKSFVCFNDLPFDQVSSVLEKALLKDLPTLDGWNAEYLVRTGEKIKLGGAGALLDLGGGKWGTYLAKNTQQ